MTHPHLRGVQFIRIREKEAVLYFSRDSFQASAVQKQSDVVHWTMKEAQQVLDL